MKGLFSAKTVVSLLLLTLFLNSLFFSLVWGSDYPTKAINLVVPFAPGGPADIQTRILAEAATKELGVPIVIVNKAGPGGALGASLVAKEKPDGYTFLVATGGTITCNPVLLRDLPYKKTDFVPLFISSLTPSGVAVKTESPIKHFRDFLDMAKTNPGKFRSGCSAATISLLWESLLKQEKLDVSHLTYKGAALSVQALMGGHVDILPEAILPFLSHLEAGQVRLLVVFGKNRMKNYPDVPTFYELGYQKFSKEFYHVFLAPVGLPQPIKEKFTKAFEKVSSQREVQIQIERAGLIPVFMGPKETSDLMDEEFKFYSSVIEQKQ